MPHGAFYCHCTWKQAQKIILRQSIPQKRILLQPSVVTGNGKIFLFCLLLLAASITASLKIARGLLLLSAFGSKDQLCSISYLKRTEFTLPGVS